MSRLGQQWEDAQPCGTIAAYKRHQRHHEPPCYSCLQANDRYQAELRGRDYKGPPVPDPRPTRNGLPFRPYVYRGTGADAFTGEVVL